ncbi:unnamed protein product [Schistosoma rodhaini]|uniref:Cornifelin n=2 Tax=Schistosoma TaxID=6181 RepID=A0A5K4F0F1_SCHMA|nr:unnamed protein product [Schistosoma rodhaini]CAH8680573.1 unnamed protein product [Schistosoma rodhaini]
MGEQVVTSQPISGTIEETREWESGLFQCTNDPASCCLALFCPCPYLCYLYSYANEPCWLPCIGAGTGPLRMRQRFRHKIKGSITNDFVLSCICTQCVMCQLKRDMDYVIKNDGDV